MNTSEIRETIEYIDAKIEELDSRITKNFLNIETKKIKKDAVDEIKENLKYTTFEYKAIIGGESSTIPHIFFLV